MSDKRILAPYCGAMIDEYFRSCDGYMPAIKGIGCGHRNSNAVCVWKSHQYKPMLLSDVQNLIRAARGCVTLLKNMDNPIEGSLDYRILEEMVKVLKDE